MKYCATIWNGRGCEHKEFKATNDGQAIEHSKQWDTISVYHWENGKIVVNQWNG